MTFYSNLLEKWVVSYDSEDGVGNALEGGATGYPWTYGNIALPEQLYQWIQERAMKILDAAPSRGKLRIRFVCGGRVLKSYRALMCETNEAVRIMNAPAEKLAEACEASIRREKEAREEIERLNGIIVARRAEEAL